MASQPAVVVPIRSFSGFSRLGKQLDAAERSELGRSLTTRVLTASAGAGLRTVVVSSDEDVARAAADHRADVVLDPGTGLNAAAEAGVRWVGDPWIVVHADLPFVVPQALANVAERVCMGRTVLVPSLDGGTTVVGGTGSPAFAFGPGSFHRHLARNPGAEVITDPRLAIDIDTPAQLEAVRAHHGFAQQPVIAPHASDSPAATT